MVWLVGAGARWTLVAQLVDGSVRLTPTTNPTPLLCRQMSLPEDELMHESFPYDAKYHQPDSVAAARSLLTARSRFVSRDPDHLLPGSA